MPLIWGLRCLPCCHDNPGWGHKHNLSCLMIPFTIDQWHLIKITQKYNVHTARAAAMKGYPSFSFTLTRPYERTFCAFCILKFCWSFTLNFRMHSCTGWEIEKGYQLFQHTYGHVIIVVRQTETRWTYPSTEWWSAEKYMGNNLVIFQVQMAASSLLLFFSTWLYIEHH